MIRSPFYSSPSRGFDADVADLQTDVMRFMAILALCLVAIFALVQSIPLAPPPQPETIAEPEPLQVPEPMPAPIPESTHEPLPEPELQTVAEPPPPAPPVEDGFTLRFETDLALTRLVARNEVGLYAITPERALRMSVNRGQIGFWKASAPNRFHEMDAATVPDAVIAALRRAGPLRSTDAVTWGVTLPATMSRQLDQYLAGHRGGELIIGPDGTLRLE